MTAPGTAPLDLLVRRGRLWSAGARLDGVDSVGVRDGVIVALGREAELLPLAGPATRVIDAAGDTVTPGLTDAHLHLLAWARGALELDVSAATSARAVAEAVGAYADAHPDHAVIVGRGWDAHAWPDAPARGTLDQAVSDRPVVLHAHDFHTAWANSRALTEAGIIRASADPDGGRIERDAAGEPTGILREHAVRGLQPLEARAPRADIAVQLRHAACTLLARGITAVHDFEGPDSLRALRALATGEGPRLRVLAHVAHASFDAACAIGLETGVGDDWFRIGGVKLFADGTLGSRTAAMLEPYADGGTGMDLIAPEPLRELVARAFACGVSVAIHAIGDRAVRASLDAFEAAGEARMRVALPPRIEHVQLASPADLPRFARLGVAASVQPAFVPSDAATARAAWGPRAERAYPWRSLITSGARVAFGSDAPVERPDGAATLHAAVTRLGAAGGEPLGAAEAVSLDQALTCATEAPARLAGSWPRVGRLAAGAAADLVVWSHDLHALPARALREAYARTTVLAGEVLHEQPAPATAGSGV